LDIYIYYQTCINYCKKSDYVTKTGEDSLKNID
jgi:hypothetical protein